MADRTRTDPEAHRFAEVVDPTDIDRLRAARDRCTSEANWQRHEKLRTLGMEEKYANFFLGCLIGFVRVARDTSAVAYAPEWLLPWIEKAATREKVHVKIVRIDPRWIVVYAD